MENQFTKHFQECISQWLEKEKANDETFASRVNKSKKTVNGCCNYILAAVKESKKTGFTNEEVYGMARHFFDEDDINDPGDHHIVTCEIGWGHEEFLIVGKFIEMPFKLEIERTPEGGLIYGRRAR